MKKHIVNKVFFEKLYDGERAYIVCSDLPLKDILPTDRIMIDKNPGYYSENNSCEASTLVTIYRPTLETDDELKERESHYEKLAADSKKKRFNDYQRLKKEFEPC